MTRDAWLTAARSMLEKRGVASVKIDRLAKLLKVTRGSFYFHFKGIKDLCAGLLEEWRTRNVRPFQALVDESPVDGEALYATVVGMWVYERPFSAKLDLAIRDWARSSKALAREVAEVDELRISLLTKAFRAMGYGDDESVVRARITYFHQIGYYTISFKETPADRLRYHHLYDDVLLSRNSNKQA